VLSSSGVLDQDHASYCFEAARRNLLGETWSELTRNDGAATSGEDEERRIWTPGCGPFSLPSPPRLPTCTGKIQEDTHAVDNRSSRSRLKLPFFHQDKQLSFILKAAELLSSFTSRLSRTSSCWNRGFDASHGLFRKFSIFFVLDKGTPEPRVADGVEKPLFVSGQEKKRERTGASLPSPRAPSEPSFRHMAGLVSRC